MALETALRKYDELDSDPFLKVTIHSDSRYAIGCMTNWINKWRNNGWINSAGNEVANRDLIEEASDLDLQLSHQGDVDYVWIPRAENALADEWCNKALDEQVSDSEDSDDYPW